jgi:ferredoxin--NADP+ reductase
MNALKAEVERCRPIMEAVGQDPDEALAVMLKPLNKALEPVSETRFLFDFLASPTRIVGDEDGRVIGLEVEDTTLVAKGDDTKAVSLETTRVLDVDTVVFCIGDRVDGDFGLPLTWNEFTKRPEPRYPQDGLSYEAFDPEGKIDLEHVFLAGWAREASSGLVGAARKDGTLGAKAVLEYLETLPVTTNGHFTDLNARLKGLDHPVITTDLWAELDRIEGETAEAEGLGSFKFGSNEEMFAALGLGERVAV